MLYKTHSSAIDAPITLNYICLYIDWYLYGRQTLGQWGDGLIWQDIGACCSRCLINVLCRMERRKQGRKKGSGIGEAFIFKFIFPSTNLGSMRRSSTKVIMALHKTRMCLKWESSFSLPCLLLPMNKENKKNYSMKPGWLYMWPEENTLYLEVQNYS